MQAHYNGTVTADHSDGHYQSSIAIPFLATALLLLDVKLRLHLVPLNDPQEVGFLLDVYEQVLLEKAALVESC